MQENQSLLTSAATRKRAVFLDRDGVVSRSVVRDGLPFAPKELSEFEILPEVPEACRRLKQAGFLMVVATKQPDLGRKSSRRCTPKCVAKRPLIAWKFAITRAMASPIATVVSPSPACCSMRRGSWGLTSREAGWSGIAGGILIADRRPYAGFHGKKPGGSGRNYFDRCEIISLK